MESFRYEIGDMVYAAEDILNDGAAYAVVVERVMANLGRARRDGVLAPPHA